MALSRAHIWSIRRMLLVSGFTVLAMGLWTYNIEAQSRPQQVTPPTDREWGDEIFLHLLRNPETEDVVFEWTSKVQDIAGEIFNLCDAYNRGTPKAEDVRIVSQEIVRMKYVDPDHYWSKNTGNLLEILVKESSCCPTARNRSSGASGYLQFLPSTSRQAGYDVNRMCSAKPEDQRYHVRNGYDWVRRGGNSASWIRNQWCTAPR